VGLVFLGGDEGGFIYAFRLRIVSLFGCWKILRESKMSTFAMVCGLALLQGFRSPELMTGKSLLLRNINNRKLDTNETASSKSRQRKNQTI